MGDNTISTCRKVLTWVVASDSTSGKLFTLVITPYNTCRKLLTWVVAPYGTRNRVVIAAAPALTGQSRVRFTSHTATPNTL